MSLKEIEGGIVLRVFEICSFYRWRSFVEFLSWEDLVNCEFIEGFGNVF